LQIQKKYKKRGNTSSGRVYTQMKGNKMPTKKSIFKGDITMVITNEKIELLATTLMNDIAFANEIIELDAEDAANALNEKGLAFTAEELAAFAEDVYAFLEENNRLGADDLDEVTGGCYYHPYRRPPFRRYSHYHYGPYCVTISYRKCRW